MHDPTDNFTPNQCLMVFADSELGADSRIEQMRRVATDPSAAKVVEHEIRLREAVKHAVRREAPPSDALVRAVSSLALQMPTVSDIRPRSIRRWMPLGVAAGIVLMASGLLIGRWAWAPSSSLVAGKDGITSVSDVVPARFVSAVTKVHVQCSRGVDHETPDPWPEGSPIAEPLKQYISAKDRQYPDLSSIGFSYLGCEPCGRPEQQGVHLLYRSVTGNDTLSLFVEMYKGQVALEPDRCYYCKSSDVHPVLVWRSQGLLFFMVGNAKAPVERARLAMNLPEPI